MKRTQLIFCVETNRKSDTDFLYIKSTIDRFYDYQNGHVQIKPVYLGGKGRYSTSSNARKINELIRQFSAGSKNTESHVFLCLDYDKYDSDPADRKFFTDAENYCRTKDNYHLIWFCRDVEDVYLGHQISNTQKTGAAKRFMARKQIVTVEANKLRATQYRQHSSNICTVLDQFLPNRQERVVMRDESMSQI